MSSHATEHQRLAMQARGRTLLVAAAAGSGKTYTLTERIIRVLLAEEAELDELLIVTFTTAAAAELRERIGVALQRALEQDAKNSRLLRQYLSLGGANILTIDAFCNDLVRRCADRVGLPPNYRVPDTAEVQLLSLSVMDTLIDGLYDGAYAEVSAEAFASLADAFSDAKGDRAFGEELLALYAKLQTQEAGVDTLRPMAEAFCIDASTPTDALPHIPYIVARAKQTAAAYRARMEGALSQVEGSEDRTLTAYAQLLRTMQASLCDIEQATGYESLQHILTNLTFPRAPAARDKDERLLDIDLTYRALRDDLRALGTTFFSYTPSQLYTLCDKLYAILTTLIDVLSIFDRQYRAEKCRLGICEYADMERYAYECLWEDGHRTPFAEAMRARFKEVYIDEYQDVNRLQDRIFEAVSGEGCRFMVGDIKQSIYGFRSADPDVFAEMKRTFPPLSEAADNPCASLYMSENFRCDRTVIDATNEVFDRLFAAVGDRIGYVEDDRLVFAKRSGDCGDAAEFLAVETALPPEEEAADEQADLSRAAHEAHVVARRMRRLLDTGRLSSGEPIRPSDIAVLCRSKRHVPLYTEILASYGIRGATSESCDLFLNPDILLTLCLLNAIDNPSRDIYLTGLLLSPLFGFTPDTLVLMRGTQEGTLYHAMCSYAEATGDANVRDTLARLAHYRMIAEGMPMDALLFRLYRETGLLSLATQHGGREHLLVLYEYARSFERSSFRGLHAFISYINRLIENKTAFAQAPEDTAQDAVRLMTVHASKGLEFPVVFVVGCGTHMRPVDKNTRLLFDRTAGIALRLPDDDGITTVDNPFRSVIAERLHEREFDEELRILYVAMTRARERLILSGVVGTSYADFCDTATRRYGDGGAFGVRRLRSYAELLTVTARTHIRTIVAHADPSPATDTTAATDTDDTAEALPTEPPVCAENATRPPQHASDALARTLRERFLYTYDQLPLTTLPEKLSVSRLSPTVLDGTEEEDEVTLTLDDEQRTAAPQTQLPAFYTGAVPASSQADRGTATHLVLQFCDFRRLREEGVQAELARLVEGRFLSEQTAALVRVNELQAFADSPLLTRLLQAKAVHRELRFHVRLPAAAFTEDASRRAALGDTTLLVQGVMDCVLEDADGNIHLIDYKTDRLSPSARADRTLAEEELRQKHRRQLAYYAMACERMFGRPPRSVQLFSLALGTTVDL